MDIKAGVLIFGAVCFGLAIPAVAAPSRPIYTVHRTTKAPSVFAAWGESTQSEALAVTNYHPRSSDHRPQTEARVLYDDSNLYVMFRVEDEYVVSRHTEYQDPVYEDSCVEFFVQPKQGKGYFNFEMNAGGALLLYYIEDPTRVRGDFKRYEKVPDDLGRTIEIRTSLPKRIDPEHATPLTWTLMCKIPIRVLARYVGPLGTLKGQQWRANFYKTSSESSHPHWGAWADVGERLDFHQPDRFGALVFE